MTAHVFIYYLPTTLSAMIEVCFDFFFSNLRGCIGSRRTCSSSSPSYPPHPSSSRQVDTQARARTTGSEAQTDFFVYQAVICVASFIELSLEKMGATIMLLFIFLHTLVSNNLTSIHSIFFLRHFSVFFHK